MRKRYYAAVSVAYIILGFVILARSIIGHVIPIAILGVVFIALGIIRLRDFFVLGGRSR